MTSPSVRRNPNQLNQALPVRFRFPVMLRRWGAWAAEVSLLAATVAVPYGLGSYAKTQYTGEPVPLNPVLTQTQKAIAQTFGLPAENQPMVAPLTNLFWSGALVLPVVWGGYNLYLLGKTGKTLPKRWLGVRVVTETGTPPGMGRALVREGVGRWGIPLSTAYVLWRYTGAFPDLGILTALVGVCVVAESMSAHFNPRWRGWRDRLAGTFVMDANQPFRAYPGRFQSLQSLRQPGNAVGTRVDRPSHWDDEDAAIAAIVLTPEETPTARPGLWHWMRQHPGLTLLVVSLSGMGLVLGTFVGTQVYIQGQANQREFKQQDNQVFLALVSRLGPKSKQSVGDRQSAILALGTVKDSRAMPLLVDLLSQETNPTLIEAIQQALVSTGPDALPYLRRLNQSMRNDLESLRFGNNKEQQATALLRHQATQRAIAKLLTIYSGDVHGIDLSRTQLGPSNSGSTQFTLVLKQADLAGSQWRGAVLAGANFRGSRFYGPGEDGRWGTFDDWIADLSGADLKDADLTGALLNQVSMERTSLIRTLLNKASLVKTQLSGANLSSAKLIGADLSQANLKGASLTGADLGNAILTQANLQNARFSQASAAGAQFSLADLSGSDWKGADLSNTTLTQVNLQNSNLSATRLVNANLNQANLQGASLKEADLTGANLAGADLSGADFQGAMLSKSQSASPDQFIKAAPQDPGRQTLRGVNFSKVRNLSPEQIAYICTQGGIHPKCH